LAVTYEEKNDAELEAMQKEMQELERQKLEKDAAVLAAKEKLVIKPPLKIKVHIKSLRHLPKMDMMGKCDGYVVVECGKRKQQTNKVKNNFDPDFNETFEFEVSKSSQSLSITVMDWESSGKDELVGRAQIPVGKLMAGTVDHELTLIGEKNQDALIGNDKQKTTVLFSLTAEHLPPPPDGEGGGDASVNKSAPWKLIVKLDHAESLPKMDVMGKCDGYVVMSCGGERKQSKTIKNEYNPQWNEEFEFDVTDNSDDFIAKIWDWDLGQQDDEVGSVRVPVSELQGKEAGVEKVIVVEKDGQMVTGHDKKPTKIALRFFAKKIEGALAHGVNQDGALQDPVNGKLTILVRRADGLPKMDSWSGKADPYLSVTVDGMTQKTTCKKKTLEPVWDETLVFSNCIANKSIVKVEMFDWESTAKDRTMGFVSVPVRNLLSYDTETYSLDGVLHDGKPTCGKVYMKFSFVPTPQDGSPSIAAQEPGVWVRVISANNLPKTDMTGKCDPLVNIEVDGQGVSTEHKVNCYDAVYTDVPFHFPESTSSSIMSVTVFDYNKLSGNKPVGFCSVDLSNAGKNGVLNKEFNVVDIKGSPVIGHSGEPCTVALSIKINAMPDEDGDEDSDEGEGDEWDIEVTAVKFSSMPKMDIMGSCDAYLKFSIQNQERRTKEVTGYEGAWNEAFSWDSINGRNSVLAIAAWDKVRFFCLFPHRAQDPIHMW
jgi:Ca2+-dependent lipid-binding protein